jgi:hypothetical protein
MSAKWFPGADEFSPSKCALQIRSDLSPRADPEDRKIAVSLYQYHMEYLRVTAHCDGNRPSPMADGTVVYWGWQAATMARFFGEVYGMALGLSDPDEYERDSARAAWKEANWDAAWDRIKAEERRAVPA